MPRSGTKLLRSLLSEHSRIAIPPFETEFFPYWVAHWSKFGDISDYSKFKKFYTAMLKFPYFIYCESAGKLIDSRKWFEVCHDYSPAGVFEALVRHDVMSLSIKEKTLWGDKSPSYINHLPLLKSHFPVAKFIHIVRDVRDYCLSINKAWGKNMMRAAQRWVDCIEGVKLVSKYFPSDYLEIRYEDLLNKPESELRNICFFLDIQFDSRILHLSATSENIGDAKGQVEIMKDNKGKYKKKMKSVLQKHIEAIAGSLLTSLDYPVVYPSKTQRLSKNEMFFYKVLDGVNIAYTSVKRRGLLEAVRLTTGALKINR